MTIVLTTSPAGKGHYDFYSEGFTNSFGPDQPWDGGEGGGPGEDFTGEGADLQEGVLPFLPGGLPSDWDARQAVEQWRIAALGRRPEDFMARDLLLHSLWRDERPRVFHSLAKKPPAWVRDHVRYLPGTEQAPAAQLTALHYLHRRQLARLRAGEVAGGVTEGRQLLARLWGCWPYGARVAPPAGARAAPRACWCRLAWLCPWCYARRAVALERRLREGPLRRPQGKHLVLVGHPSSFDR
jgi:hypothetical protein